MTIPKDHPRLRGRLSLGSFSNSKERILLEALGTTMEAFNSLVESHNALLGDYRKLTKRVEELEAKEAASARELVELAKSPEERAAEAAESEVKAEEAEEARRQAILAKVPEPGQELPYPGSLREYLARYGARDGEIYYTLDHRNYSEQQEAIREAERLLAEEEEAK